MDLTVVVPTRNEAANVAALVARAAGALADLGLPWEIVFVDDSDDRTPERVLEAEARGYPVRLLHRLPQARTGGMGGAVLVGFEQAAGSETVVVMDGDLQHPPELLPALVSAVRHGGADIAVASRYVGAGGGTQGLEGAWRRLVSKGSRSSVRLLFPPLRAVSDPLAGFFAIRRPVIDGVELRPEGFKILLEVLLRGSWSNLVEVPCALAPRQQGRSKAGLDQGLAFGRHVARLLADHGGS